jgi:Flp pilus assembly protein TadD
MKNLATPTTALAALAGLMLLAGCATATGRGQAALHAGQYGEAAARFEEALTDHPDSVAALTGLGLARYRMGSLDEAQRALTDALRQAPDVPVAHLYLGLIALLRGDDPAAGESLRRYAALGTAPRLAAAIDRGLRALAAGSVTPEMRRYVASSIEDQSAWAGELLSARQALAHSELLRLTDDRWALLGCRCYR